MADWEHEDNDRVRAEREWRGDRDWRGQGPRESAEAQRRAVGGRDEGRAFGGPRLGFGRGDPRTPGDRYARRGPDRPASYETGPSLFDPGGAAARGYGEGGDTAYGQMVGGSSDSGLGGYGGTGGGYGQPNLNSQWGAAGYGPLNQGLDYGHGGGSFGPAGYDTGDFGQHPRRAASQPHDEHHASYRTWRDTQLASHDRDYGHWREEQARRYDEDYGSWRNERHAAFSKEFEGWRTGRGGQATASAGAAAGASTTVNPSTHSYAASATSEAGYAHGANPTLARIADGETGKHHADHEKTEHKGEADKDPSRQ